jgi:integrase
MAIQPFSLAEAVALLAAVKGDRWEAIYTVAIACGLRQGEILGLRWADVDLENGDLHVRYQLQRDETRELTLVPLKTDKSRRTVRLPAVCIEALRRHQARPIQDRLLAGSRWQETGLVFTTSLGTAVDQRNLLKHYAVVVKAAGIRRLRFHDLRHTAASVLLAQPIPMKAVQATLEHADMRTTMNTIRIRIFTRRCGKRSPT